MALPKYVKCIVLLLCFLPVSKCELILRGIVETFALLQLDLCIPNSIYTLSYSKLEKSNRVLFPKSTKRVKDITYAQIITSAIALNYNMIIIAWHARSEIRYYRETSTHEYSQVATCNLMMQQNLNAMNTIVLCYLNTYCYDFCSLFIAT